MGYSFLPKFTFEDITGSRFEHNPWLSFVLLITAVTLIYAWGYLQESKKKYYVLPLLAVFGLSMAGFVISNHLLWLYFFWECTSIFSFLLIGTNHESEGSRKSAVQALFVTGSGGLFLLIGLMLLGRESGSFHLDYIIKYIAVDDRPIWYWIIGFIFIGIATKSALFPIQGWLPNAMVAPAPVSGFLHSATLVKAGVILLITLAPVFQHHPLWIYLSVILGGLTAWYGALMAFMQTDLKRALAYTTSATIGVIAFLGWSESGARAALLWVLAHGLYKSAAFYLTGIIEKKYKTRNIAELQELTMGDTTNKFLASLLFYCSIGMPMTVAYIGKKYFIQFHVQLFDEYDYLPWIISIAWQSLMIANYYRILIKPFYHLVPTENSIDSDEDAEEKEGVEVPKIMQVVPMALILTTFLANLRFSQNIELHHTNLGIWEHWTIGAFSLGVVLICYDVFIRKREIGSHPGEFFERVWDRGFEFKLRNIERVARVQTNIIQNGHLRYYLTVFILATAALLGGSIVNYSEYFIRKPVTEILLYEVIIVILMIIAALKSILTLSRMASIVALGAVGMSCSALYLFYSAPDLAMTQFLTDTLIVIVMALVFYDLPRYSILSTKAERIRDGIVAGIFGAVMSVLVLSVTDAQMYTDVMDSMLSRSIPEAHGHNVVNVILADFRAFDTMGEITVLATAAIGMYGLLRIRVKKEDK